MNPQNSQPWEEQKPENVLAGTLGAFVAALIGGVLCYILYRVGIVAGAAGLATVVLANIGYKKLSGRDDSIKGIVISVLISIVVLLLALYVGMASSVRNLLADDGINISLFEAIGNMPEFLFETEFYTEAGARTTGISLFIKDAAMLLIFSAIPCIWLVRDALQKINRKKAAGNVANFHDNP